jgi:hypothetical protein
MNLTVGPVKKLSFLEITIKAGKTNVNMYLKYELTTKKVHGLPNTVVNKYALKNKKVQ